MQKKGFITIRVPEIEKGLHIQEVVGNNFSMSSQGLRDEKSCVRLSVRGYIAILK